jgi:FKBP-type peptidyl-prolyl cis-trans isomerase SlyD
MANTERLTVQDESVVTMEYRVTLDNGEIVEASDEDGPMQFIQGRGHVYPAIEAAIIGLAPGDEKSLALPPEEAFGEYDPDATELIPLDLFPEDMELIEGDEVELYDEEADETIEAVIVELQDDYALVDLNHPLAGETLQIWVKIIDVRPATPDELEHDHVHGDHGHEGHGHDGHEH